MNIHHKGIRKGAPGMKYEHFSKRIMSIREYENTNVVLPNKSNSKKNSI